MNRTFLLLFALLHVLAARAQFSVRLVVTDIATRKNEDVYVSGNFNNWNPRDENYKLKPFGGSRKSIVIKDMPAGTYAFKFTRGAADRFETTADGRDINDRVLEVNGDVSQEFSISGWKDDYPEVPRRYTASPQVRILDTAFLIPQLSRKRKIWIYLPKSYAASGKLYPVLYMQDGQDLFNEKTAKTTEWGVDECLDTLQQKTGRECIVVGIEHGGDKRNTEYNPYDNPQFGKEEGRAYSDFLAHTLKPYIDSQYRTRKGPESTFVAGADMGALISLYAAIRYPNVFGTAALFSPSLFMAPFIYHDAGAMTSSLQPRFYLYAGGREAASMVSDLQRLGDILRQHPRYLIRRVISPLGQHNETTWRNEFAPFYLWLMNE